MAISPPYQIIYADPPWLYNSDTHTRGKPTISARHHYPLMALDDIAALDVRSITDADSALLFLWATGPMLYPSMDVMRGWGFKYATAAFVWKKQRPCPGYYTMSQTEFCLVGKVGKIPQPRGARNVRQFVSSSRGSHSVKPDEVREGIDRMFPTQNKIELFARSMVPGWDAWGIDVGESEPW